MTEKPTYKELEQRIKQLESDVLEYIRKEKEFNEQLKLMEYSHLRRTISLMKINEGPKRKIKTKARNEEKLAKGSQKNFLIESKNEKMS